MDAEERFAALVTTFAGTPGVTPPGAPGGRRFGSEALKVDGAIFAMLAQGSLVLKLPRARVESLVSTGAGSVFTGSGGRPMREWVALAEGDGSGDVELTREALEFVRAGRH